MKRLTFIALVLALFPLARAYSQTVAEPETTTLPVRFVDSATGYAIQPDEVLIDSHGNGAKKKLKAADVQKSGRALLSLEKGKHTVTAASSRHKPLEGDIEVAGEDRYIRRFLLDPVELPAELRPARITSMHRADATFILGYVVDEETGQPVANVQVSSLPSQVKTKTDARGYFEIYIPVPKTGTNRPTASLSFRKAGYKTQEHARISIWPHGDWTLRISLETESGTLASASVEPLAKEPVATSGRTHRTKRSKPAAASSVQPMVKEGELAASVAAAAMIEPKATPLTNATVRVPRTIRVIQTNNVTIDYLSLDNYVKHSLPHEWPATWGQFTNSVEAFKAGAIADRSYAAAYVASPRNTYYDICPTTACQVYKPGATYTVSDTAVDATSGYVVLNGSTIASSEYSAENNSLGFTCGDGYTSPTGGCIYDPVCTGQTRSGHGRGMCQWGTLRWATGLKFEGNWNGYPNNGTNGVTHGYPTHDWVWMVEHYYPDLTLVRGTPLIVGDDVKASASIAVRMNSDGSISNATAVGMNCPSLGNKASGSTGVIITNTPNPVLSLTNDGYGYTWYKIKWSDGTIGWSPENWLQRVVPLPAAPTGLTATAVSGTQINLSWATNSAGLGVLGFKIQRGSASSGPWTAVGTNAATVSTFSDTGLAGTTTYYYRVLAYNVGGDSTASSVASATTPAAPPSLIAIPNATIYQGQTLSVSNAVVTPETIQTLTDFESSAVGAQALFRTPRLSGSTSAFLESAPDVAMVTNVFPAAANLGAQVLAVACSFNSTANPWLRLTTGTASGYPNPVIDFTKRLRFNIYSEKAIKVALGCRETTTAAGTPIGANGGTTGTIEFVGSNGKVGDGPNPTRTVPAGAWTTLTFNIPSEPVAAMTGDGVLSTASGLGVFECLAIVPSGGIGTNKFYLDNFAVVSPKSLTYSLLAGAPAGASITPTGGVLTWTPTGAQAPSTNTIQVKVTDNGTGLYDTKSFVVTVLALPRLQSVGKSGSNLVFNWNSIPGRSYRIQWKTNLEDPTWNTLSDLTAATTVLSCSQPLSASRRFYRVLVLN